MTAVRRPSIPDQVEMARLGRRPLDRRDGVPGGRRVVGLQAGPRPSCPRHATRRLPVPCRWDSNSRRSIRPGGIGWRGVIRANRAKRLAACSLGLYSQGSPGGLPWASARSCVRCFTGRTPLPNDQHPVLNERLADMIQGTHGRSKVSRDPSRDRHDFLHCH
jgi:hypothetical protein